MTRNDWMLLLALSLLWGGSFFFVEIALAGLAPLSVVIGRVGIAAIVLGLLVALGAGGLPRRARGAALVMGFLNNAVPFTLFALAQGRIDGGLAAIVNATTPLWTVIVAHLATRDELATPAKAAGVVLGFAGVAVMAGRSGPSEAVAILLCLAAALSYGLAAVWGRRFRRMGVTPLATAFGQTAAATILVLPLWLAVDRPWTLGWPGPAPLAAVLAIALLSTVLAYLIYFRLLASAGATNLSLVTFLIPVSAVALGVAFLGESLAPRHVAGFVLIALGLMAMDGRMLRWTARLPGAR